MAKDGKRTKFIFVTGGVVSSLGKGLASASIGALLESRNLKVTIFKMDPYINVDPGTMSPFQHGEVFDRKRSYWPRSRSVSARSSVTSRMSQKNNFTTGQVYDRLVQEDCASLTCVTNLCQAGGAGTACSVSGD